MKNTKKVVSLLAVLLLVTSCGKVPKLANGQEVVVKLKNGDISVDELYKEMKDDYGLSVLLDMVDTQVLAEVYKEDADEKNAVDSQVSQYKSYYEAYLTSQFSSFDRFLYSQYGIDGEEEFRKVITLSYRRGLATDDYIKENMISDKEIDKYYDDEIFGEMKASHILIKADYEDGASDEEIDKAKKAAKEKAEKLIKQLNDAKKEEVNDLFAKLAKENSDDGSAEDGGDLGWFEKGDMVEAFESAARKLKENEYTTEPVESEFGYHIILKTGQKDKPSKEDAKEDILDALVEEKKENEDAQILQTKALDALRKKYDISFQDDNLKKQYKAYVESNTQAKEDE